MHSACKIRVEFVGEFVPLPPSARAQQLGKLLIKAPLQYITQQNGDSDTENHRESLHRDSDSISQQSKRGNNKEKRNYLC